MRYYLGVHKLAPIAGILRVAGNKIQKIHVYVHGKFWHRIMKMDDSKLVKHIFNYDYGICQNNVCWYEVYFFSMLDMSDLFNNA